jgi:hypothetical protein
MRGLCIDGAGGGSCACVAVGKSERVGTGGRDSRRRAPAVPLASKENSLVWGEGVVVSFCVEDIAGEKRHSQPA